MNLYTMVGSNVGSAEAAALCMRLAAWHDAMVAHERKLRSRGGDELCDEECPHAEARLLWNEALVTLGARAHDLSFLRTRALNARASKRSPKRSGYTSEAAAVGVGP